MPSYSHISAQRLATAHPKLQLVFKEAIKVRDISILCGFRSKEEQDVAFKTGNSKTPWPQSKHNVFPSLAVDAIPYPFDNKYWKDREFWISWSSWVRGFAAGKGVILRSGYDWDSDFDFRDQTFYDGPHFELVD